MLDLRSLIGGLPSVAQYLIVLALVMALLYVALILTRKLGSRFDSKKVYFDDPEKYADSVPDLFATTEFRKGKAKSAEETEAQKDASRRQNRNADEGSDGD